MANAKLFSAFLVLSLLFSSLLFSNACGSCGGTPPAPVTQTGAYCPRDALKLGVCADVLGLVHAVVGSPPSGTPCCALLQGLADLEVAACLCTAIKANVLGVNLNIPLTISVLLSACQKTVPPGFKCQ